MAPNQSTPTVRAGLGNGHAHFGHAHTGLTCAPPTRTGEPEGGAGAYAEADVTGGSAYALAGPAHGPAHGPALPSFPRHCLRFREKLGEGQFGEVSHAPLGIKSRPLWFSHAPQ